MEGEGCSLHLVDDLKCGKTPYGPSLRVWAALTQQAKDLRRILSHVLPFKRQEAPYGTSSTDFSGVVGWTVLIFLFSCRSTWLVLISSMGKNTKIFAHQLITWMSQI